jgi:enterochelin esterase-like enzyme
MDKLDVDIKSFKIHSRSLAREVLIDFYFPQGLSNASTVDLLLVNDGQDLHNMDFLKILSAHQVDNPLLVIGIHAGKERKQEYGVIGVPDYLGRGALAGAHADFVIQELLLFFQQKFNNVEVRKKYLAGFSLGGLMAFDMLLEFPHLFSAVGVFSGSFWWRSKSLEHGYVEERDRIMHAKIRKHKKQKDLRIFLQTGQLDEVADRNKNGIIDSIDDTLGIIDELVNVGYSRTDQITYLELDDGKHDVETWARVMPVYLKWLSE